MVSALTSPVASTALFKTFKSPPCTRTSYTAASGKAYCGFRLTVHVIPPRLKSSIEIEPLFVKECAPIVTIASSVTATGLIPLITSLFCMPSGVSKFQLARGSILKSEPLVTLLLITSSTFPLIFPKE